jgi:ABC-2 type transport system ATP-binding protein
VIEAAGLRKSFGDRVVLDGVDDEIAVAALSVHTPDLDDVFLALTGRSTAA